APCLRVGTIDEEDWGSAEHGVTGVAVHKGDSRVANITRVGIVSRIACYSRDVRYRRDECDRARWRRQRDTDEQVARVGDPRVLLGHREGLRAAAPREVRIRARERGGDAVAPWCQRDRDRQKSSYAARVDRSRTDGGPVEGEGYRAGRRLRSEYRRTDRRP